MSNRTLLTISELAKLANITTNNVRYYEKEGLLKAKHRSESGYRLYDEEDVYLLCDIIVLRDYGLTIKSIKRLIHNYSEKEYTDAIKQSYQNITAKIKRLETIKNRIENNLEMIHSQPISKSHFQIRKLPARRFVIIKTSFDYLDYSIKELYDALDEHSIQLQHFYNSDFYFDLSNDLVSFCIADDQTQYDADAVMKEEGSYLCYSFFVSDNYDKEQKSQELYSYLREHLLDHEGTPFLVIKRQYSMINRPGYMAELQIKIKTF